MIHIGVKKHPKFQPFTCKYVHVRHFLKETVCDSLCFYFKDGFGYRNHYSHLWH